MSEGSAPIRDEAPTALPVTEAATFCATLVDEWVRCGLTDAVVAPGSRSTPLALALAADGRLRVHVHHDERSAAFLALGLGLATGRPAPVLTTSGTATVHLHAAAVEAHHACVPLICCTADRPPELRDVGAPQTIDQEALYGPVVRWFVDAGVPDAASRSTWRSLAARAVHAASGPPAGPVQLNLPFRDPLVGRPGPLPQTPHIESHAPRVDEVSEEDVAAVLARAVSRRGVVVAGGGPGGGSMDPDAVHALGRALGWPVFADPRSGCRTDDATTIAHFDALLRVGLFADAHRPEVVLQLGQPPASKVLAQWIAGSGCDLVAVDADGRLYDPDHRVTLLIEADPSAIARRAAGRLRPIDAVDRAWSTAWADADRRAAAAVAERLASAVGATEPGVARAVLAAVPDGGCLVASSSMPVRDVEWYGAPRRGVRVISNRGTNGIDGVTSTAVGVALAGSPTALLIGDVAFLHDTNGLLALATRGVDLVIVVVNNDGGGIFSFLPPADQLPADRFELLFGTPHGVDVGRLAEVHGIEATTAISDADVGEQVAGRLAEGGVHVVVARTDRAANVVLHDDLHAAVAAALEG